MTHSNSSHHSTSDGHWVNQISEISIDAEDRRSSNHTSAVFFSSEKAMQPSSNVASARSSQRQISVRGKES